MTKVLYSGFRFSHHTDGSGYDCIVADRSHYVCGNSLPFGRVPETALLRKINFLLVDLCTLFRGLNYPVIHYFYPENTAYFSTFLLRLLGKRIVYTVHLAESAWFSRARTPFGWMKRSGLRRADLIITLSSQQAAELKKTLPQKKIRFVRHGMPLNNPLSEDAVLRRRAAECRVVVVGTNYRDFDMLEQILALRSSRKAVFHLVGLTPEKQKRFSGVSGVLCHSRLSASQYRELLQSCFVMALPLTFATANNALLEAYQCCLPSICSDIPGISDYTLSNSLLFRDAAGFWEAFDRLARLEFDEYRELCLCSHREAGARFSWEQVREEIAQLVRSI